jgi:hypothetical protein
VRARLVTAAAAALLGALSSTVMLALFYALSPRLHIEFGVDPPRLLSGVHPAERDEATGLTFAWTGADVALRLPGLDRRVPWSLEMRVRGGRENPADNPELTFYVDGVRVTAEASRSEFADVRLAIPPRPDQPRGARVTVQVSRTFVPGPNDPRPLGVMLDRVTVAPEGLAVPPPDAFAGTARAGALLAAAVALLGVTPGSAVGAAILIAAGQGAIVSRGFAPYTDFAALAARLAMSIGLAMVLPVLAAERLRGPTLRNTARFAVAFTGAALFLKLLVLLHPDMPVGDALFQAHRFQEVIRGNYYFTSIAPGNYLFPYAPGLYVAALPFADMVRREAGDVMLLRIVVAATDAAVGVLLYAVVVRAWSDRRAAAFAAALYQLIPLDFMVAAGGTLTNAFAQSLAVPGLAVMSAHWLRLERLPAVALLVLALLAPFLSHTSTFAILSATTVAVAFVFAWRGGPAMRSPAAAVLVAGVLAVALAIAVYYAHFLDTYRTELGRIGGETATGAADAGGRSIADRARAVPMYVNAYFGIPVMALVAAGAWQLWRRSARDRLTLTVAGWSLACGAFLLIGVLTPVDMRYYVAALPAMAIVAAAGASAGWSAGGTWRAATVALLAWSTWLGLETWWTTLR